MPIIVQANETKMISQGDGWQEIGLADTNTFGAPAMIARRWVLAPGIRGPELVHGEEDQLLYVIRGSGMALVHGESLPLLEESVLWLEPGEQYQFVAGEDGLEILQGYAVNKR
jgi:quercetin dioxygenase-like cupin family protein